MAADIATSLKDWSTTASSNQPDNNDAVGPNTLAENLRQMQSTIRYLASSDTIASATTTDLGTKDSAFLTVSGTTTITGLGTVSAGIYKFVTFSGVLTLTHNGTSLILPGAQNITTTAGSTALFLSLGSGNWRLMAYADGTGNVLLGGGRAILGDFTDSTVATIKSNGELNSNTYLVVAPGATGVAKDTSGVYAYGGDDPENTHYIGMAATTGRVYIYSNKNGTGTVQPISISVEGGNNSLSIDPTTDEATLAGCDFVIGSTGKFIKGDFSNTTLASRVLFKSSTTNGNTIVGAVPNGTSTIARFIVYNTTDPTNSASCYISSGSTSSIVASSITGTGTVLPLQFVVGTTTSQQIGTAGEIYFPVIGTTASAANAYLNNGSTPANQLLRSTSSRRYKTDIRDLPQLDLIGKLRPVVYRSLADADDKDLDWYGLIAEEVAEVAPRLVHYTKDEAGNMIPDGVQYDRLTVLLVQTVQSLGGRLAALEAKA